MKYFLIILFVLIHITSFQQQNDTTFEIHYFKDKKISTKQVILKNSINWGYAKAYNYKGEEIYSMGTRKVGGHGSVNFTYFENGGVKTAHYTSHPDGGIQWSDIIHCFDENGKITKVEDRSSDDFGRYRIRIDTQIVEQIHQNSEVIKNEIEVKTQNQEVAQCAEIYITEIYLINYTRKKIDFSLHTFRGNLNLRNSNFQISPKDTLFIGDYIEAQSFTSVKEVIQFHFPWKKKSNVYGYFWLEPILQDRSKRICYALIVDK